MSFRAKDSYRTVQDPDEIRESGIGCVSSRHYASDSPSRNMDGCALHPPPNVYAQDQAGCHRSFCQEAVSNNIIRTADGDPSRLQRKDRFEAVFLHKKKRRFGQAEPLTSPRDESVPSHLQAFILALSPIKFIPSPERYALSPRVRNVGIHAKQ